MFKGKKMPILMYSTVDIKILKLFNSQFNQETDHFVPSNLKICSYRADGGTALKPVTYKPVEYLVKGGFWQKAACLKTAVFEAVSLERTEVEKETSLNRLCVMDCVCLAVKRVSSEQTFPCQVLTEAAYNPKMCQLNIRAMTCF